MLSGWGGALDRDDAGRIFSLMQFLFAPVWGRLSDRVGRRPVMLMSIAVGAIGYTLFGFSRTLTQLFACRMLSGFGAANIGTAQAIIADSTTAENRAKGMGLIGAAFGLGFIFGPAIGGAFVHFGLAAPAFVAGALGAVNWVSAFFILPETHKPSAEQSNRSGQHRPGVSWHAIRHAARHANVPQLFFLFLTFPMAFSLMEQVLGLFIEHSWLKGSGIPAVADPAKRAAAMTTYFLVVTGVTATVVQGGLIGKLAKRFGERHLLRTGIVLVGLGLFCIPLAGAMATFAWMLPIAVLIACGTGITNPSLVSLLSQAAGREEQGEVLGLGQSLSALGRIFGPAAAGALFQISAGVPFWVGSGLMVVCSFFSFAVRRKVTVAHAAAIA